MTAGPEWGLLRTAGLPVRLWLEAANPALTARLRRLLELDDRYAADAAAVAAEVGEVLVAHPAVDVPTRRLALAARRRLHRGRLLAPGPSAPLAPLAVAARAVGRADLARRLTAVARLSRRLAAERAAVTAAVDREQQRLLAASWATVTRSVIGRQALLDGTIAAGADIGERLRSGTPWNARRLRRRSDYLWRMVARGAAEATPLGWLGHAALVPLGRSTPDTGVLTGEVAARWTEDLDSGRRPAAARPELAAGTLVALAPLHRCAGGQLEVWPAGLDRSEAVTPVRLRLSPALAALVAALRPGARTLADLEAAALPADPEPAQQGELRGFVGRLVEQGVLQVADPPRTRRTGWRVTAVRAEPLPEPGATGGLDVYRRSAAPWPASLGDQVEAGLALLHRLTALIDADQRPAGAALPEVGGTPRPLLDLLAERLDPAAGPTGPAPQPPVWPAPHHPGSGYRRLLDWLADRADRADPAGAVDLTAALLDRLGAPPAGYAWPVDCLVRPLRTGPVVLDAVAAAGVLDARFAAELESLHGRLPQVAAHREFLRCLDAETGVRSVELLAPPRPGRAADPARRPRYTDAWTGDPQLAADSGGSGGRYVPLDALTVRRDGDRLALAAGGEPVRIVYHGPRLPPPWDQLLSIVLADRPAVTAGFRRLRHSLPALPGRQHLPRVTLGGSVIVTPAQWRLGPGDLWDRQDSLLARAGHLLRLRDGLGLPRWVLVCRGAGGRPVPCDLDSLRAPAVLESAAAAAGLATGPERAWVVIEEMVPSPDEFVVRDTAAGPAELVAAELLLRFPRHLGPAALARATAAALAGAPPGWPDQRRAPAA